MQKDLYYDHKIGQDEIQDIIKSYPGAKDYYDYIARSLGCDISDLAVLLVNPDFEGKDEEGWNVESFFPVGAYLDTEVVSNDYETRDFYFGQVISIVYNNERFIANQNASPLIVWAKIQET